MQCDTCGKETDKVKRVVVAEGYDRTQAVTIFNCEECLRKRKAERQQKRVVWADKKSPSIPPRKRGKKRTEK